MNHTSKLLKSNLNRHKINSFLKRMLARKGKFCSVYKVRFDNKLVLIACLAVLTEHLRLISLLDSAMPATSNKIILHQYKYNGVNRYESGTERNLQFQVDTE